MRYLEGRSVRISIHAPRTGSDTGRFAGLEILPYFNPRSPHGERPSQAACFASRSHFNPRSPHGERRHLRGRAIVIGDISIHAPRTGSDVATVMAAMADVSQFQSTLPARGATITFTRFKMGDGISIHAPRTGSDWGQTPEETVNTAFQSTLPARGATETGTSSASGDGFQSTLPARGATAFADEKAKGDIFQSTLPARGATHGVAQCHLVKSEQ